MKFLFDENLSPSLVQRLSARYPESVHVRDAGLKSSSDTAVWNYAAEHEYTIVTKDGDFRQRSFLFGSPPKVIWIGLGNCSTNQIAELITERQPEIQAFGESKEEAFLSLR